MPASAEPPVEVPDELVFWHRKFSGEQGQAWVDALPDLAGRLLDLWDLRSEGPPTCGAVALVVPVRCAGGTPAVLKLQPVSDETAGEPDALRTWRGDGAVRLLDHDPASGSMLLERLDARRSLETVEDHLDALQLLSELLARLSAVAAPAGMRRLSDVGADLLARVPRALALAGEPARRHVIEAGASALAAVLPESGDRLLHWDLHYSNVLAPLPGNEREPWLAIDPKPLAGDPGFELLPALHNRWDDAVATGDVAGAIRRRFDLMTEILAIDRARALAWTLARVLQNVLWDVERGDITWHTERDHVIAETLLDRAR